MNRRRLSDLVASLRQVPGREDWRLAGRELAWALPLMLVAAYAGGLVRVGSSPEIGAGLTLAFTRFVAPALGEELLFRGVLIPRLNAQPRHILLSSLLFLLWHPLQAVTYGPPWAGAFLNPWFLAAVAILGVALGRIYAATGSLWPCIAVHWLVVVVWKVFLGGPF